MFKFCLGLRFWVIGICSLALVLTSTVGPVQAASSAVALPELDPRVLILQYYLQGYDAPFQDQAAR